MAPCDSRTGRGNIYHLMRYRHDENLPHESGSALYHLIDKYCGVINVGPFGCMNSRMTESVATCEMTTRGKEEASKMANIDIDISKVKENIDNLPFLNIELDGNPFSQILEARLEIFMLQAERLYNEMKVKFENLIN